MGAAARPRMACRWDDGAEDRVRLLFLGSEAAVVSHFEPELLHVEHPTNYSRCSIVPRPRRG